MVKASAQTIEDLQVCLPLPNVEGTTRAEDAQGTPTQSHISTSILEHENKTKQIPYVENAETSDERSWQARFSQKLPPRDRTTFPRQKDAMARTDYRFLGFPVVSLSCIFSIGRLRVGWLSEFSLWVGYHESGRCSRET